MTSSASVNGRCLRFRMLLCTDHRLHVKQVIERGIPLTMMATIRFIVTDIFRAVGCR